MARNAFVRATVLTNVRGRIRYATSPEKQERLMAYVSNMPKGGWLELSKYSRQQAAAYHPGKKVCEARELIIMLPNSLSRYQAQSLAIRLRDDFSKKHGVPCAVAVHWNKAENNYHVHLIFSERGIRRELQGVSIATRNTYFDADGKRSTKKDCLDELGNLKPGCRFVKKGETLSAGSRFGAKKNIFAQEEWLHEEKNRLVNFFNANDRESIWKVYDWKSDPHFPFIRIVKGDPPALNAWRERENEWRREYNEKVDRLIANGEITTEEALQLKFKTMRNRSRLRKERAENRKVYFEQYRQQKARTFAEYEYARELRKMNTLELLVELALVVAGVDTVKLRTGIELAKSNNGPRIKIYQDKMIQEMIDSTYKAMGRRTPSEELMLRAAAGDVHAKILTSELQKNSKSLTKEKTPDKER